MYKLHYFDKTHTQALLIYIVFSIILLIIPKYIKEKNIRKFEILLGIFALISKISDSLYRIYFEKHIPIETLPFNLCNISLILCGIYLITRNNIVFNLTYFYFFGAFIAILIPDFNMYETKLYIYMFMHTHFLEIIIVFYGYIYNSEQIHKKGLITAIITYLILVVCSYFFNKKYHTNYMFVNNYVISAVKFIKPFYIYQITLIMAIILSMIIMYLPFVNANKEIDS